MVVAHLLSPALGRRGQVQEFRVSLSYLVGLEADWAKRDPRIKNK